MTGPLGEVAFPRPIDDRWFEDHVPGSVYEFGHTTLSEMEIFAFARDYDPRVAMPLKPFRLPGLASAGQNIGSAQITARVTVINIWASWCVACRAEAATLERTWPDYHSRGVQFIGIDTRDTRPAGMAFERKYGVSIRSGFDSTGSIGAEYGLMGVPDTLIVGPHSTVRFLIFGALDDASFRQALDTAQAFR